MMNLNGASPKYSKLEILEAVQVVINQVQTDGCDPDGSFAGIAENLASDILAVLEGKSLASGPLPDTFDTTPAEPLTMVTVRKVGRVTPSGQIIPFKRESVRG